MSKLWVRKTPSYTHHYGRRKGEIVVFDTWEWFMDHPDGAFTQRLGFKTKRGAECSARTYARRHNHKLKEPKS